MSAAALATGLVHATTPADLGERATLLVEKHAAYIKSFSRIWEVRVVGPWRVLSHIFQPSISQPCPQ